MDWYVIGKSVINEYLTKNSIDGDIKIRIVQSWDDPNGIIDTIASEKLIINLDKHALTCAYLRNGLLFVGSNYYTPSYYIIDERFNEFIKTLKKKIIIQKL